MNGRLVKEQGEDQSCQGWKVKDDVRLMNEQRKDPAAKVDKESINRRLSERARND
jgi:hypothetical protein